MANFTLYELTEEARELQDMIEEYPPETFSDTLEGLQLMIEDRANDYGVVYKNIGAEIKALKEEEGNIAKRRISLENNQKRLNEAIKSAMEVLGEKKIVTTKCKFIISNNGGLLPIEIDAELLPDNYKKVIVEPDKELIRKAIESGIDVPGVKVLDRGTHLTIK